MNIETCEALHIDERGELSWTQLIELSGLTEAELRELVDDGALAPVAPQAPAWSFHARSVVVARTAGRLRRELDLDPHALAVVLRFVARIEDLEAELRALRAGAARHR
jgi:chaperone modulatory protein CbpM